MKAIHQRFWDKVKVGSQAECWPWQASRGSSGNGHGLFKLGSKQAGAHRLIYEWANGPLAADQVVRHKCDNPSCVNPWHLEPGTRKDNARDAVERGQMASGERNGSARLTAAKVSEIRGLAAAGATRKDLAAAYGVSAWTIGEILRGRLWAKRV